MSETDEKVVQTRLSAAEYRRLREVAAEALTSLYDGSAFRFRQVPGEVLDAAVDQFRQYDDHGTLSFIDHAIAAHADAVSVEHVLTFDADFETFGLTTILHFVD